MNKEKTISLPINQNYSINVEISKKKMKNIRLKISNLGKVCLSIPNQVSYTYAYDFLIRKREWIVTQINRINSSNRYDFCSFQDNGQIFMLGKAIPLRVIEAKSNKVNFNGEMFNIYAVNTIPEYVRKIYLKWCKNYCKLLFSNRLNMIYSKMFNNTNYPEVKIKTMKSMWGNCNFVKRVICLNIYLIKSPTACIDYVIIHELAHLVHHNHSKEFHSLVQSVLPNWKECKKLLNSYHLIY